MVQVFVYKINQASLGITAVNDGPAGQFTLTSNNFDFSVGTSFNDVAGNDGVITFNRTIVRMEVHLLKFQVLYQLHYQYLFQLPTNIQLQQQVGHVHQLQLKDLLQ